MSRSPSRLTRPEIHEAIRFAAEEFIRLYDASEDAASNKQRERADKKLYGFALGFLAEVAGPAIGRVLERERDSRLPDGTEPAVKGSWHLDENDPSRGANSVGVNMALASLLLSLEPALGRFPTKPVVRDLVASVLYNADPLTLRLPERGKGEHNHADLRQASRQRIVLAVHFLAGWEGCSIPKARKQATSGDIVRSTWNDIVNEVPQARKDAVHAAGKEQAAAQRENRAYVLADLDAVVAKSDLGDMSELINRAISKRRGLPEAP